MNDLTVSVCVPTHARPELLAQALESVLGQSRAPAEVVVSDNVGDEATAGVVAHFAARAKFPVRHIRCLDGGSPTKNFNCVIQAATSDLLLILHDDDLLCPEAVEALTQPFLEVPGLVASYGQHVVISDRGEELEQESEALNRSYHREAREGGLKIDSVRAAILQQFPCDGYMVRASAAKAVLYDSRYGSATDVDFGIRCASHGPFYFVPVRTAKYRLSIESISRGSRSRKSDDTCYQLVRLCLQLLDNFPLYRQELELRLRERAGSGIVQAVRLGHTGEAFSWLLGPYHRRQLVTLRGAARGLYLVQACLSAHAHLLRRAKGRREPR